MVDTAQNLVNNWDVLSAQRADLARDRVRRPQIDSRGLGQSARRTLFFPIKVESPRIGMGQRVHHDALLLETSSHAPVCSVPRYTVYYGLNTPWQIGTAAAIVSNRRPWQNKLPGAHETTHRDPGHGVAPGKEGFVFGRTPTWSR